MKTFSKTYSMCVVWIGTFQTPLIQQLVSTGKISKMESADNVKVDVLPAPTLNFNGNKGLKYAISFDSEEEQIANFNGHYKGELGRWQANPIIESRTTHKLDKR